MAVVNAESPSCTDQQIFCFREDRWCVYYAINCLAPANLCIGGGGGKCYRCQKEGHMARDCPDAPPLGKCLISVMNANSDVSCQVNVNYMLKDKP
jgi:hypothetical protein